MTSFRTRRPSASLGFTALLGMTLALVSAATVHAQVVSDPRIAEFDPSPDHWAVLGDGQSAVVRYELGVYMAGAAAPFTSVDMGKPSPESDGKIRYDFSSGVSGWPLPGGAYEARVSAIGPEGEALSDPSNAFTFTSTSARTTPVIDWVTPAAITYGTALSSSQLNATASVAGTFVYSPPAGRVLAAGTYTLTAAFTPADTTLYTTATAYTSLTVNAAVVYQLTVTRPTGGTVQGAGINCGTSSALCQVTMPSSMSLGLQAAADSGYTFSGWSGDCSGTSASYTLSLNGAKVCGATFTAVPTTPSTSTPTTGGPSVPPPDESVLPLGGPYTLTIMRPSGGVVKSAGINCGTRSKSCAVTMPGPMTIGLQATADPGYTFLAWIGHCSGSSSSLALALEGPRTCGASFIPAGSTPVAPAPSPEPTPTVPAPDGTLPMGAPYTLTVTRPTGGTIQAAGIACGTKGKYCSVTMPAALWLGLEATPDKGYVFSGWTGNCSAGTSAGYLLALNGPRTCGATFTGRN